MCEDEKKEQLQLHSDPGIAISDVMSDSRARVGNYKEFL